MGESSSHTHVVAVTLTVVGCDGFSISATNPSTLTVDQGQTASATVSTAVTKGSAQPVSLSVSGLPAGATASFSPSTVTTGGSSKLTVSTTTATPCGGSYTLTIIGRDKDLVWAKRTLPLQLTGCIVNGDFSNGLYGWSASDGVTVAAEPKLSHVAQLTGTESIAQTFRAPASGGRLSLEFTNPAYGPWLVETPDGWAPRDNSFDCGALQLDDLTAPTGGLNVPVGSPLVAGHTYKLSAIHLGGARYFPSGNINCDAGPTTLANVTIKPTT